MMLVIELYIFTSLFIFYLSFNLCFVYVVCWLFIVFCILRACLYSQGVDEKPLSFMNSIYDELTYRAVVISHIILST